MDRIIESTFCGILLSILTFYIRIRPRLSQRNFGIDSWYYLLYTNELRKAKRIPVKLPYFLLDIDEQWYPPGLPILLALFSQRFLERFQWAISPLVDTIQMIILYLASYFITKNILVASVSAILYATSPIVVSQNSNLNSRGLGALLLTLVMLSLYQYTATANLLYLILMVLGGAILLHTHKLASQQMLFLFIGFSILYFNLMYLLILAGIYLAAIILSGGFYLNILKGHIAILRFWRKNLPNLFAHQVYQSPLYKNEAKAKDKRGCGGIVNSKLWLNLSKFQFSVIFITILFYAFIYRWNLKLSEVFFLNWFIINFLSIVIISYFKPVKFLGEGHRYFMYGIFPSSFLLAQFIFKGSVDINIGIFILLTILIINLLLINKIHNDQKKNILATINTELKAIVEYIKELPKDNIMCFPFSYCEPIAYFCRKKTLWGAHGYGYDNLEQFFPVLLKPVEYFVHLYGISYCLINRDYVSINDMNLTMKYKIIMEKKQYCLLEFV